MYQRTDKLTVATDDAAGLVDRIQADVVPLVEAASGFISYTIVKMDDLNVLRTRLFRNFSAMGSATQSTSQTTGAIANDFQVSDALVDSDVSLGQCMSA